MSLFVQVADTMPDQFAGPWKLLFAKVVADEALWEAPPHGEEGRNAFLATDGWRIDEAKLSNAWPRLVAECFCC